MYVHLNEISLKPDDVELELELQWQKDKCIYLVYIYFVLFTFFLTFYKYYTIFKHFLNTKSAY